MKTPIPAADRLEHAREWLRVAGSTPDPMSDACIASCLDGMDASYAAMPGQKTARSDTPEAVMLSEARAAYREAARLAIKARGGSFAACGHAHIDEHGELVRVGIAHDGRVKAKVAS